MNISNQQMPSKETQQPHDRLNYSRAVFMSILILLLGLTISLVGYKTYIKSREVTTKKVVMKQEIVRRSSILGIILKATTAKAIDVNTGKIIRATRIFSLNDKTIYLALGLNNAKMGTYIDYIRYLNGRYVDHGNVKIVKDATNNITFSWTNIKSLGSVNDGKWKIATYTNGILEKRVSYVVKKDQVSKVYQDEPILSSDLDFQLTHTIALLHQTNP